MHDLRSLAHVPVRLASPLQRYAAEPGRHTIYDDLVLMSSGGAGPESNVAAVLGPMPPEHVFTRADAFFGPEGYALAVEVGAAPTLEAHVVSHGWHLDEEEPSLVLTPVPANPPSPLGLSIRSVADAAGFDDFLVVSEDARRWVPSLAAALDPAVALFVGYINGEPVATSRLTCLGEVGDINGVVTLPAQRRQGIGTAMTWAACAEGVRRGCAAMTLTASAMGYPVYVRMGFVPVCTYRTYMPPPHAQT